MNNYQGLRINQKTVAIPLRTKNYSVKICDKKMLQDEDQDSRQRLRPRSRPKPRPLQLQSCSINNNSKLSRIFLSQLHFKNLHSLACGFKLYILWSYTLLHHYLSIRPRMCSTFEHCFPRSVSVVSLV